MPRTRATLLAGLTVAMSIAVPAATASGQDTVDWRDCGDGLQCAKLIVPVDRSTPDGPKTTVDIARMPARDQAHKRGSLVVNTGGPTTTIQPIRAQPAALRQLTNDFDVVLIDPRGYGDRDSSSQRPCGVPAPHIFGLTQADNEREWNAYAQRNAAYDASCRQRAGQDYQGFTSWQIAHDLEALRTALGEQKLNYLGNSYGAVYGQAYAELFGSRIGRMYLEGVPDHTQPSLTRWLINYARTDERQLGHFAGWCAQRRGCPLNGSDAIGVYDSLLRRVERHPLPAPGAGKTVDGDLLVATVREGLNPPYWPNLARALDEARDGDAGRFLTDPVLHPKDDPPGAPSFPGRAALCHDFMPDLPSYPKFQVIESTLRAVAPRVGWMQGRYQLGRCLGIAPGPAYPPHPLHAPDAPPVLVGIGELDNNTNPLGAQRVAEQLPGAAVLRHGDGHAAYLLHGGRFENSCLRGTVNAYLTRGALPKPGTRCPAEILPTIPDRPAG